MRRMRLRRRCRREICKNENCFMLRRVRLDRIFHINYKTAGEYGKEQGECVKERASERQWFERERGRDRRRLLS